MLSRAPRRLSRLAVGVRGAAAMTVACCIGGTGIMAAAAQESDTPHCGRLLEWSIPDAMRIYGAQPDTTAANVLLTKARLNYIIRASELYCQRFGSYPTSAVELIAVSGQPTIAPLCKVTWEHLTDGWERPVYFGLGAGTPLIQSAGADGRFSTADDVRTPSPGDAAGGRVNLAETCPT